MNNPRMEPLIERLSELSTSMNGIKRELFTLFSEISQIRTEPGRVILDPAGTLRRLNQLENRVREIKEHINANIRETVTVTNELNVILSRGGA